MADKKNNLGTGVMIGMLAGNEETVETLVRATGKEISKVQMVDETLVISFTDGTGIKLWDDGQSCCENRYMVCDDEKEFDRFIGAKFASASIADVPTTGNDGDVHEVQFLNIMTSKGVIQAATHNEHNGYYGGFWIKAANV